MNAKLWVCVIFGVLIAHISVLFIVDHIRALGKPEPKPLEPNFTTSTTTYVNERGEKVKTVREFTVQTELVPRSVMEKLPPPPSPEAALPTKTAVPAVAN